MTTSAFNTVAQAGRAARVAADRAGVFTAEVEEMADLGEVSVLFEQVWGRNAEGVPLSSEVMRSLVHAGGAVTVARDRESALCGAAVLVRAPEDSTYSLIAGTRPGTSDRGIGRALKLRQRRWALDRGLTTMRWTFDPLVGRNARFNLTRLGAVVEEYIEGFYGRMSDEINAGDEADRLAVRWSLDSVRAVAATEGTAREPLGPDLGHGEVLASGPDGEPAYVRTGDMAWLRVPADVVALRRAEPSAAHAWRLLVRHAFADTAASGLSTTGTTRTGWYHFTAQDITRDRS